MDKKAIGTLARKIIEADTIGSAATHISMCVSSTSRDKFIMEHNESSIKRDISKIKDKLHRISEYVEEMESHVYNGELNDEQS